MVHAKLIKTCWRCQKTIRVDTLTDTCPSDPLEHFVDGCADVEHTGVGYCPVCHKNTDQTISLVHGDSYVS